MPKKNFNSKLQDLEKIVQDLQKDEANLEDALAKYEEGIKLFRQCKAELAAFEKRIAQIKFDTKGEYKIEDIEDALDP